VVTQLFTEWSHCLLVKRGERVAHLGSATV